MKIELSGSRDDKRRLLVFVMMGIVLGIVLVALPYQAAQRQLVKEEAAKQQAILEEILREVRELR